MKEFYTRRLEESQAELDELSTKAAEAEGDEFSRLVEYVTAIQGEVNNWRKALSQFDDA